MATPEKHALVLGASGISGWALMKEALQYPTNKTFARVTATTNRPLTLEQAQLPPDPRLKLVNGVDFTKGIDQAKKLLQEKIPDIETVTHVFFCAYIHASTFDELREVNSDLLSTAATAVSTLCPDLQHFTLQTGGKRYGVEFTEHLPLNPPLKESQPRIPQPFYDNIFYYSQVDILASMTADTKWTFTEVIPDVIIGFVPSDNAMDAARGLALYLSLRKAVQGAGSTVPFPGTLGSYTNRHTDTFQDILARMHIYAALHPQVCGGGQPFNVADGAVVTWEDKWPGICEYFGLVGAGPMEGKTQGIREFVDENKEAWREVVRQHGLVKEDAIDKYDWGFLEFVTAVFNFDREYDLSRSKEVGFTETIDTVKGFTTAFDRLRAAKIIP